MQPLCGYKQLDSYKEMNNRPQLSTELNAETFKQYYYLKEELVCFCRDRGLQTTGSKAELTERIATYLNSGESINTVKKSEKNFAPQTITPETEIENNFVCSEKHRAFFKERIGNQFTFIVPFQKWLKANAGKTYREAIQAYYKIIEQKKTTKIPIDSQFEYNTYIRDFFAYNRGKSLQDAIKCWNYKKSLQGHNRYEESDLIALR